jgi:hypothetical protein
LTGFAVSWSKFMEQAKTNPDVLSLGIWLGRKQALGMIAGRCVAAEIECLSEVYERKLYLAIDPTWEDYCKNRLGISRRTAERLIRNYRQQGASLTKLTCFTRIRPAEYRLFAAAVTDDGLLYNGETIPLEPENAPRLVEAVEAIRQQAAPPPEPDDPVARAFDRAEKSLHIAIQELTRLRAMDLGSAGWTRFGDIVLLASSQLDSVVYADPQPPDSH